MTLVIRCCYYFCYNLYGYIKTPSMFNNTSISNSSKATFISLSVHLGLIVWLCPWTIGPHQIIHWNKRTPSFHPWTLKILQCDPYFLYRGYIHEYYSWGGSHSLDSTKGPIKDCIFTCELVCLMNYKTTLSLCPHNFEVFYEISRVIYACI